MLNIVDIPSQTFSIYCIWCSDSSLFKYESKPRTGTICDCKISSL